MGDMSLRTEWMTSKLFRLIFFFKPRAQNTIRSDNEVNRLPVYSAPFLTYFWNCDRGTEENHDTLRQVKRRPDRHLKQCLHNAKQYRAVYLSGNFTIKAITFEEGKRIWMLIETVTSKTNWWQCACANNSHFYSYYGKVEDNPYLGCQAASFETCNLFSVPNLIVGPSGRAV